MLKNYIHILSIIVVSGLFFTCTKEQALPVNADFEYDVVNNDYSIPVQIVIFNKTEGADSYEWTFEGGKPAASFDRNPGAILYEAKGEYKIRLFATNIDDSESEKVITIKIDDPVIVNFEIEVIESNFPPVEVAINNSTTGASSYKWEFLGGNPSSSTNQNPPNVIFDQPGEHKIRLEVNNGLETYSMEKVVVVEENLNADFGWEVNFDDDDYQAPVSITMENNSISATTFQWTFENGVPSTSTESTPKVVFNEPGDYQITLIASNGKNSQSISKSIQISSNTNIRSFENVKLGINTSHNNNVIGSFFSTSTRNTYASNEVNDTNGKDIDLVFFGLNSNFTLNKFVSPDEMSSTTFNDIPGASHTKFINSQESCICAASMSVLEFDTMTDDTLLQSLIIEETTGGLQQFNNSLVPRIVLFENTDGKKGAIKIKEYVQDGQNSYIVVDIKVQKIAE